MSLSRLLSFYLVILISLLMGNNGYAGVSGAGVGGEAGAAIALQGEKFNRQLHQKEIDTIKTIAKEKCANDSACISEWTQKLTKQALRQVDAIWSLGLGPTDTEAAQVLAQNAGQFTDAKGNTQQLFSADSYAFMNARIYAEYNPDNKPLYDRVKRDFDIENGLKAYTEKLQSWESLSDQEKQAVLVEAGKKTTQHLADVLVKGAEMTGAEIVEAISKAMVNSLADTAKTVAGTGITAAASAELLSDIYAIDADTVKQIKAVIGAGAVFGIISRRTGGVLDNVLERLGVAKGIPKTGDKVYRVWGDRAGANGRSWSRTDPSKVKNYRNEAGLPDQNSGRFVTEGTLTNTKGVTQRNALPLNGNKGGLDELVVPDPAKQIRVDRVSGVNPEL